MKNFSRSFFITANLEAQVIGQLGGELLPFRNIVVLCTIEGFYEVVSI